MAEFENYNVSEIRVEEHEEKLEGNKWKPKVVIILAMELQFKKYTFDVAKTNYQMNYIIVYTCSRWILSCSTFQRWISRKYMTPKIAWMYDVLHIIWSHPEHQRCKTSGSRSLFNEVTVQKYRSQAKDKYG